MEAPVVVLPALLVPLVLMVLMLALERIETVLLGRHPALGEDPTLEELRNAATPMPQPDSPSTVRSSAHRRSPASGAGHGPVTRRTRAAGTKPGGPLADHSRGGEPARQFAPRPAGEAVHPRVHHHPRNAG
jgi:hypothetical protein